MSTIGFDLLGLGHELWKIQPLIALLPTNTAIGAFTDDTFGNAWPKVRKLLETGKHVAFRGHAHWDQGHKLVPEDKLRAQAKKYEQLAKDFPNVKVYCSHSCEYSSQDKAAIKKRIDIIRAVAPSCIPVNTPMKSPVPGDAWVEKHAAFGGKERQLASSDGESIGDGDAERYIESNKLCDITFLWAPRFNLRQAGAFIPPKQRKTPPDSHYIRDVVELASKKGAPPIPTFGPIRPVKKPVLWKTWGEDKLGNNDPRANKPLLICPEKDKQAVVLDYKGNILSKLPYYGTYLDQGFRYYSGSGPRWHAYQFAAHAIASSGSPFIWFKVNGKYFGPVHGAFRAGYFQW